MIHHCGSGTYQYQILHQLPAITIGTKFTDREDIAIRLEELGVSCHIQAPDECDNFLLLFKKAFNDFREPSSASYQAAKPKLAKLYEASKKAMDSFDFERVLEQAVEKVCKMF